LDDAERLAARKAKAALEAKKASEPKKKKELVNHDAIGIDKAQYAGACPHWAKIGECKRNPGFMLGTCKKSCHKEIVAKKKADAIKKAAAEKKRKYDEANPTDKNKNCGVWARNGACKNNPGYMLNACALSCKEVSRVKQPHELKDYSKYCNRYALLGLCKKNAKWMLPNCELTCYKVKMNIDICPKDAIPEDWCLNLVLFNKKACSDNHRKVQCCHTCKPKVLAAHRVRLARER
jgi:hypothetical protein